MTSIAVVFNRNGIAFAADSAGSVDYKVFDTNKLFHLTAKSPIGVGVYGLSQFHGVPRELIIKEFKKESSNTMDSVALCKERFIEFISDFETIPNFSTEEVLKRAFGKLKKYVEEQVSKKNDWGEDTDSQINRKILNNLKDLIKQGEWSELKGYNSEDTNEILESFEDYYDEQLNEQDFYDGHKEDYQYLIKKMLNFGIFSGESGIVIAGFGSDEFFPSLNHVEVKFKYNNKVVYEDKKDNEIQDGQHGIRVFAQREATTTLLFGRNDKVKQGIINNMDEKLTELRGNNIIDEDIKNDIFLTLNKSFSLFEKKHGREFGKIVGLLNLDELGSMAETFVNLECFRTRMRMGYETVSGPIDVAVISRYDGFIRLKRKQYFSSTLNNNFKS